MESLPLAEDVVEESEVEVEVEVEDVEDVEDVEAVELEALELKFKDEEDLVLPFGFLEAGAFRLRLAPFLDLDLLLEAVTIGISIGAMPYFFNMSFNGNFPSFNNSSTSVLEGGAFFSSCIIDDSSSELLSPEIMYSSSF